MSRPSVAPRRGDHAPRPNQHERANRQAVIDNLIGRALRGVLTIPEAAVLAEYWQAERRVEEKTRRRLTDTTRALQRHREAADAEIRRLEAQVEQLLAAGSGPAHNDGPSIAECAEADRAHWTDKYAGEGM